MTLHLVTFIFDLYAKCYMIYILLDRIQWKKNDVLKCGHHPRAFYLPLQTSKQVGAREENAN